MKTLLSELEANKEIQSSARRCSMDFVSEGVFVNANIPKKNDQYLTIFALCGKEKFSNNFSRRY